jgi:hypothetical protein
MGSLRSHPYGIELHPVTGIARITCKQEEPSAPSPPAPTTTAAAAQRALAEHGWPDDAEPRVRVGIHTGEAAVTDDDDGEPTARLHLAFQARIATRWTRSTSRQSRQAAAKTAPAESAVTTRLLRRLRPRPRRMTGNIEIICNIEIVCEVTSRSWLEIAGAMGLGPRPRRRCSWSGRVFSSRQPRREWRARRRGRGRLGRGRRVDELRVHDGVVEAFAGGDHARVGFREGDCDDPALLPLLRHLPGPPGVVDRFDDLVGLGELAKVMGTSVRMIEQHYGALLEGLTAGSLGGSTRSRPSSRRRPRRPHRIADRLGPGLVATDEFRARPGSYRHDRARSRP